jgi:hypothetical protein
MSTSVVYVGLDVHKDSIVIAVAREGREAAENWKTIPYEGVRLRKALKMLVKAGEVLKVCYEAGPTGYALYWQLAKLGIACRVIAPTLVPMKAGDRVKTDRRDAERLARSFGAGELTAVWVPDTALGEREEQAAGRPRGGARDAWLHLGYRASPLSEKRPRRSSRSPSIMKAGLRERRLGDPRKGEPSRFAMRQAFSAGFATLVRGSSRRITTILAGLKSRSTNIRVINRRRLASRPLLAWPCGHKYLLDKHLLTGHFISA